ncbi:MAG: type II secretion system protein E [Candidatus Pacebacteria bacterium GW2011_GWF2_38_9]|nr:MAG: putative type II secretion system protein E [candidate division TM6 bacterium GW2011_GWF2_28_16]KKQ10134.1 MAG: type II secretion system protein E [Candidatus Pacebacteria bacterium GW2011_GWF1_36_5]KKQ89090.1 MAG: type II secretion system protein E [Candidatus Pacebacteria bacterium GW2011_GWF2_38_9]HAZ73590.1 type II secretion system protein E [Candidatus Paceibacterota bacterium]
MLTAQNDTQSTDQVVATPVGSAPSAQFIPTNSFLDVLFEKKQLTLEQIEELRKDGLSSGKSYEVLIGEKKTVSEAVINEAKAVFNHLGYIDLGTVGIDPEALGLLDESIAKRYKVLPFALDKEKNSIKIAMLDPLDLPTIEFLRQKTNRDVEAYYADTEVLQRLIVERYSQNLSTEVDEALRTTNQYQQRAAGGVVVNNSGQILRDAPINRIVENILDFAISSRASDVHIEPQGSNIRVRYRIDGILVEKLILPKNVHEAVISRIKIMSNLKIDEKRLPQDGRFNYVSSGKEVDLRISTLPTVNGEKVVMRLLEKNATVPSLQDLGLSGLALRRLMSCIKIPQGIILITGPTGSGKTTTLYSVLHMINNVGVNIMTLEDPVEYQIPGISQVQVNPKAGLTFASGLRSFLRQDPDIIMVGEIRDNETADLALQASLTGHLVFATLHTNSAAGALPRLLDMEAEPFLLSSSMLLTLGQRVVRRINPKYREEYKPEPEIVENIKQVLGPLFLAFCKENNKDPENIVLYRPMDERPVNEPDYKGRVAIFEVMSITPEISQLIMKRSPESALEEVALKQGMILMKQDGYLKALGGVTTIEEVLRVADVK